MVKAKVIKIGDSQAIELPEFVGRTEALKFAMFENGNRPQAVIMVPGVLELDINGRPHPVGNFAA